MNCRSARMTMVAARDGEIRARRQRALERHLDGCSACRAERVAFEGVLGALDRLPLEADVPVRLEQAVMRRVRAVADEEPATASRAWARLVAPAIATTAVIAVAVVGMRAEAPLPPEPSRIVAAPAPRPVAVAPATVARRAKIDVPAEPPAALAERPDLFMDLPMLRDFDKIRHYDAIAGMTDDDGPAG